MGLESKVEKFVNFKIADLPTISKYIHYSAEIITVIFAEFQLCYSRSECTVILNVTVIFHEQQIVDNLLSTISFQKKYHYANCFLSNE